MTSNNLEITKLINASPEEVFSAWRDPDLLRQWFAPEALQARHVELDFRIGGSFSVALEGEVRGQQTSGKMTGTYKEIVANKRLGFGCTGTWRGSAPETTVTVTFHEIPSGTEFRLVQEGFIDEKDHEGHKHGWGSSLDKLPDALHRDAK